MPAEATRPSAHAEQVDDKDEGLPGPDDTTGSAFAVGEARRDCQPATPADFHSRDALIPALDHPALSEAEAERVAAIPRRIELLACRPRDADVVHVDLPPGNGLCSVADREVFELELRRRLVVRRDLDLRLLVCRHSETVSAHAARRGAYPAVVPSFADLLASRPVLLADGATGTNYHKMGIEPGVAPEEWVFDAPDNVRELHRRFLDAGSDLVLTCTFGATTPRLAHGPLAGRAREVNLRAAELARDAAGRDRLVAGSMGPTGQLPEPYGLLTRELCVEAYAEQALALADGGVDLLVLETFFALEEALWAIEGVQGTSDLPLVMSFSFDQGTHTMMGLSPADVVAAVKPLGVAALGANCGRSLEDTDAIVDELIDARPGVPLWIKPNAGIPHMVGDNVVYDADPETLADHIRGYADKGARIVGGCCGSTPEHIAAIARALGSQTPASS